MKSSPSSPSEFDATAARHLLGKGSVYTLATALQASSALLILPFVTRLMSEADFGVVATSLIVAQVVGVGVGLGLPAAITRIYFQGQRGRGQAVAVARWNGLSALAFATLLAATGSLWWPAVLGSPFDLASLYAVVAGGLLAATLGAQALLRAESRAGTYVLLAIGSAVIGPAVGLLLLSTSEQAPSSYVLGVALGHLCAAAGGCVVLATRRAHGASALGVALGLGLPTVPHVLSMLLLNAGDRVVVQHFAGLAEVGRYQVAYLTGSIAIVLMAAANNAWAPLIYGTVHGGQVSMLRETTSIFLRLAALGSALLSMTSPLLITIMSPADYGHDELVVVASIVSIAVVPVAWYLANVHPIFVEGKTRALVVVTPISVAISLAASSLATWRWGIVGTAIASVAGYVVLGLLMAVTRSRVARGSSWDIAKPWWPVLTAAMFAAASTVLIGMPAEIPLRAVASLGLLGWTFMLVRRTVAVPRMRMR